jgi:hypothetical protein
LTARQAHADRVGLRVPNEENDRGHGCALSDSRAVPAE